MAMEGENRSLQVTIQLGCDRESIQKLIDIFSETFGPGAATTVEEAVEKGIQNGAAGAASALEKVNLGGNVSEEAREKLSQEEEKKLGEYTRKDDVRKDDVRKDYVRKDYATSTVPTKTADDTKDKDDKSWQEKWSPVIMKGVQMGAQGLKTVATKSLGFVEMIYGYMKRSSPLMQSIESLFNLAVQMFFLPLGTKLAETILPATLDLVDAVLDIWDKFEGKSLGEMMEYAIKEGTKMFGEYISNIGETLKDEKGIVGSIGNFLVTLGEFIENKGESIIQAIFNTASLILDNFKEFVSIYIGLMTAQIGATIGGSSILGNLVAPIGALGGAGIGFAVGTSAGWSALTVMGYADGGYVPSREGGTLAVVGEGGEGEHIIPDSKADAFAASRMKGSSTYNITINGYTDSELKRYVQDVVSEQVSFSRLKGSFRWRVMPHFRSNGSRMKMTRCLSTSMRSLRSRCRTMHHCRTFPR